MGDLSEGGRSGYGRHDSQSDRRSMMSSMDSVTLENHRASTPYSLFKDADPFSPTSPTLANDNMDKWSVDVSALDSIPFDYFPAAPSPTDRPVPRIVITGAETHLIGPDNSMARFARQSTAEHEAELTRRMLEIETAHAAKRSSVAASSSPPPSVSGSSAEGSAKSTNSEVAPESRVD